MDGILVTSIKEIAVALPGNQDFATASTIQGLLGILTSEKWPRRVNDMSWRHAFAAGLRSLQGELEPAQARKAFVAAARDAHLKVLPDDEQLIRNRRGAKRRRSPVSWRHPELG